MRETLINLPHPETGEHQDYKLVYDLNALVEIESKFGKSIQDLFDDLKASHSKGRFLFNAAENLFMLAIGLKVNHPELTVQSLGKMVSLENYVSIAGTILNSFFASFAPAKASEADGGQQDNSQGEGKETSPSVGAESVNLVPPSESNPGNSDATLSTS